MLAYQIGNLYQDSRGELTSQPTDLIAYTDYSATAGVDEVIISFRVDGVADEPHVILFGRDELPLSRALASIEALQQLLAQPEIAALVAERRPASYARRFTA